MSSPKQIEANRANAQRSTGPSTTEGKARAAANGVTHGLRSSKESLFAAHPEEAEAYRAFTLKLRKDCQPDSAVEEEAFQRYAWSSFQATRARSWETHTEDLWLDNPSEPKFFGQFERTLKITAMLERRADSAMKELRQLQRDRFAAYEVYAEHCVMGEDVDIPKSLPTADLRNTDLQRTNPNYMAQFMLYQTDSVKKVAKKMIADAKVAAKNRSNTASSKGETTEANSSSNPFASLSIEELLQLAKQTGLAK